MIDRSAMRWLFPSLFMIAPACAPGAAPAAAPPPAAARPPAAPAAAAHAPLDSPAFAAQTALYEVFVRDFSPSGDFRGVMEGLDRIEAAGAQVIWLMPIHPVGEVERKGPLGSPYSGRDYYGINPNFGTEADLRALVEAAHARGLKLILDWVPNHTAWDHVWVSEHPEYYARDAAGEMTVPRDLEGNLTDWTDVVELDYDNAGLRRAMIEAMSYWIEEFDIDGYRVDVAGFIPPDFYRELIPALRSIKPVLLLAEWDEPWLHEVGFDLTYPWSTYHRLKQVWLGEPASEWVRQELEELARIPEGGYRMRMTTNHDETAWDEPPVHLFGGRAGARAAFVAMALLPGPPLLYNGQEVESPQELGLFVREAVEWDQPHAAETRAFYQRVVGLSRSLAGRPLTQVTTDAGDDVIAYRRGDVLVLANARDRPVRATVQTPGVAGARDLLSGAVQRGGTVSLPAHGALVLELASTD